MKKVSALLLLLVYLLSATELVQVLKLPLLFSHYAEHLDKEKSHSFLDFLKDHYIDDDGTISDNDTDRKLPFKETGRSGQPNQDFIPLSDVIGLSTCFSATASSSLGRESLFFSCYVPGIWQPPKLA